jgi:hypothetical protein
MKSIEGSFVHFARLGEYSGWFWLPGRGLMAWSR